MKTTLLLLLLPLIIESGPAIVSVVLQIDQPEGVSVLKHATYYHANGGTDKLQLIKNTRQNQKHVEQKVLPEVKMNFYDIGVPTTIPLYDDELECNKWSKNCPNYGHLSVFTKLVENSGLTPQVRIVLSQQATTKTAKWSGGFYRNRIECLHQYADIAQIDEARLKQVVKECVEYAWGRSSPEQNLEKTFSDINSLWVGCVQLFCFMMTVVLLAYRHKWSAEESVI